MVRRLFEQAIELPTEERQPFLENACENDTELLETVLALLIEDENKHSLFQEQALDLISPEEIYSYIDKKIGAYRIIRELGSGGMGVVFLAEREEGDFEQKVAIKLLKRGMDSQEISKRFKGERQMLARLQHPNIARLLDGGLTEDGLPFFTMEYVEGEPIDKYCDKHKLTIKQRLQLFQTVCSAVQYAHRNLLIHRDLKPANILVTEEGEVKLLDFGIAKVISTEENGGMKGLTLTQAGVRLMTPEYASPEQARGDGVNIATDVYSLGIILYELLTGLRPYRFHTTTPSEIERIICDTATEKPSSALHKLKVGENAQDETQVDAETISASRSTRLERLQKTLSGDLDNICLMSLRKEPDRRYASVEQLRDDVRRHLNGLPVLARSDTFAYRTQKFMYRNKLRVLAAGAVLLLIAGLVGFYTARLSSERTIARLEAQKAEQVSDFLKGLFEVSNPRESGGETITARELLDRGALRLEEELAEQPAVRAEMMHVIGEVYGTLGLFEKADTLLNRTLDLRRKLYGEKHPDVAKTLSALGVRYEVLGRFAEAAAMQRSAIAILREHSNDQPLVLASSLHSLAHAQMRLHHLDDAERLIREALAIKREHLGDMHQDMAYSLNILGDVHTYQGRYEEAIVIHQEVLTMRRELLGSDHLDVAVTLHNIASTLLSQERYTEAEAMFREALRLWKKLFGNENREVGNTLSQMAFVVGRQGRYEESEAMQLEAISILRRVFGDEHPTIASSFARLARLRAEQGRYAEAEAAYRQCLAMDRRLLGDEHPDIAQGLARVGTYVWKQGRYKEAEGLLLKSYQLSNSLSRSNKELKELARTSLVDLYEAWGRPEEVKKYTNR